MGQTGNYSMLMQLICRAELDPLPVYDVNVFSHMMIKVNHLSSEPIVFQYFRTHVIQGNFLFMCERELVWGAVANKSKITYKAL